MKVWRAGVGLGESAVGTPGGRRVMAVGGMLMIVACLVWLIAVWDATSGAQWGSLPHGWFASQVVFSAAIILLAVGVRGRGSVVAGQWVGMVGLVGYAVSARVPVVIAWLEHGQLLDGDPSIWWPAFVFGFVGVVEIARIGAVRGAGRWLPLVLLSIDAAAQLIERILRNAIVPGNGPTQEVANHLLILLFLWGGMFLGPLILGITALVQASSARRRARTVALGEDDVVVGSPAE
jgi:hypothetical protein